VHRFRLITRDRSELWTHGDFLKLWGGQTVSAFGTQVSALALPLLAVSVLQLHAFAFAALSAIEFIPFTFLSLPAGVWVDRLPRRPLLIVADWGRALALATIPIVYAFGALTVWQVYAVALVTGALTVFFDVAYQSYLPSLISREQLNEGNAKLELTRSTAQLGGPGLAGILVSALTAPIAVAVDAASFALSAFSITAIRRHEERPTRSNATRSMRREIIEGLRYVLGHPYMRPSLIYVAISNFFTNGLFAILILYAVRQLHMSAAEIGLMFSLGNAGFLVGSVVGPRTSRRIGIGPTSSVPQH
jgi:hypothetical protein